MYFYLGSEFTLNIVKTSEYYYAHLGACKITFTIWWMVLYAKGIIINIYILTLQRMIFNITVYIYLVSFIV